MKQAEKDYTVRRIREVQTQTAPVCQCAKPDLRKHIREAAVRGDLKLKPISEIQGTFADMVINLDRYSKSHHLDVSEIFQEPDSYKIALSAHKDSEDAIDNLLQARSKQFDKLVDSVHLNKFEDGEEAIKAAVLIK